MADPRRRPDRPDDRFYYGQVGRRRVRLDTSYKASVEMLRGILQSNDDAPAASTSAPTIPLTDHLGTFIRHLTAEHGGDSDHIRKTKRRLSIALTSMGARVAADLNRDRLNAFLIELLSGKITGRELSPKTRDHYAEAIRCFAEWLVDLGHAARNPFGKIRRLVTRSNREAKQTFTRRPFTIEELERLIDVTRNRWRRYVEIHPNATEATLEGYRRKGEERAMAYMFAAWTAPRHEALRQLRWSDLDLAGKRSHDPETGRPIPTVMLRAVFAKNQTTFFVPIVPFLVEELRAWRKTKAAWLGRPVRESDIVFDLPVHLERKLREDAALAGIEARTDAVPPERIDFHAMRTTTATLCVEAGLSPKVAQQILQHKTIEQTLEVYARLRPEFTARELEKLPAPRVDMVRGLRRCGEEM